jgi:hypothetical protein
MEIDFIFYRDCSLTEPVGEWDLWCNGHSYRWGDTSTPIWVKNYYSCEGKWLDCNSTCAIPDGGYFGCLGALGTRGVGCSSGKPAIPIPPDDEGGR